jgi:hypothetical protein
MNIFKSEPEKDLTETGRLHRKVRLARFVRSLWPDLMKAEPPKTEPAESSEIIALRDSWRSELQIENPYVPLAHRK